MQGNQPKCGKRTTRKLLFIEPGVALMAKIKGPYER
ncbi:hypothetical protein Pint_04993 [Pistacia integerrima]|uniref:Uncharacterized protein n=1 Tax=Pistacia integerrima TaxID=434235 RepID=A0ACC0Z515_9ROSI|nr:hypothetical protein Pint_04993 [Pistacia integerrima]